MLTKYARHLPTIVAGMAVSLGFGMAPSQAAASEAFLKCRDIAEAAERLQCYDAAAKVASNNAQAVPEASPAQAPTQTATTDPNVLAEREKAIAAREAALKEREAKLAQPETAKTDDQLTLFGIPLTSKSHGVLAQSESLPNQTVERDSDGDVEAINTALREWSFSAEGWLVVVLENGQVWRQFDGAKISLRSKPEKPHQVRIARGIMGSFNMTINDSNKLAKVRRIDVPKRKS